MQSATYCEMVPAGPFNSKGTSSVCLEHPQSVEALVNTVALTGLQEFTKPASPVQRAPVDFQGNVTNDDV